MHTTHLIPSFYKEGEPMRTPSICYTHIKCHKAKYLAKKKRTFGIDHRDLVAR